MHTVFSLMFSVLHIILYYIWKVIYLTMLGWMLTSSFSFQYFLKCLDTTLRFRFTFDGVFIGFVRFIFIILWYIYWSTKYTYIHVHVNILYTYIHWWNIWSNIHNIPIIRNKNTLTKNEQGNTKYKMINIILRYTYS